MLCHEDTELTNDASPSPQAEGKDLPHWSIQCPRDTAYLQQQRLKCKRENLETTN